MQISRLTKYAFLSLFYPLAAQACPSPIQTPYKAIALYDNEKIGRLENQNLLQNLCPTHDKECETRALAPETETLSVYDKPDGQRIAAITITYAPGKGLSATIEHNGKSEPFTPIISDADWGYGPYFHTTLLETRDAWQRVALPTLMPVWVKMANHDVLSLNDRGSLYDMDGRTIMVLDTKGTDIVVRDEQPFDMCSEQEPPENMIFKTDTLHIDQLYDASCNLKLDIAYKRGC